MKLIIKDETRKASIEITDDSNIYDTLNSLCGVLVSYGFHPDSIDRAILEKAEEIKDTEEKKE